MALANMMRRSAAACGRYTAVSAAEGRAWSARPRSISVSASSNTQASGQQEVASYEPKLVVFGGRGFVGSAVCQEALKTGLQVIAISRSGTPPPIKEKWIDQVSWVRGNALEPPTYAQHLQGALGAISCIGGFGNQEQMLKVNGTANVTLVEQAAAAGVPRFVFISATVPSVPGIDLLAGGYIRGKKLAEEAVMKHFPSSGVILRPWVIYGDRVVSTNLSLPLQTVFRPAAALLDKLPNSQQLANTPLLGPLFYPPADVHTVAKAAVRAATDSSVPAGTMDAWQVAKYK